MTWERVYAEVCERKYGGNTHQPRASHRGERAKEKGGGVERRNGRGDWKNKYLPKPDNYFSNLLLRSGKLNYISSRRRALLLET